MKKNRIFDNNNYVVTTMTIEEKIDYWKEISKYDIDTASVILKGKRFLYVGFMCRKWIENKL